MFRFTFNLAVLALFFSSSFAQVTLKDSASVIQVRQEPRHHDVVDNEWVRILDVHIPPGDTSLFHKHSTPSIFIVLGNTKTGSQALIEPRKRTFSKESIWFEDFSDTPRIHRVWNEDRIEFHTIDIELPHMPSKLVDSPVNLPPFTLLFDESRVRGYRVTLDTGKVVRLNSRQAPVVIVGLSDVSGEAKVNEKTFREKGDYLFLPAGTTVQFANKGAAEMQFAFFELK